MELFGLTVTRKSLAPVADNRGGWWPVVREPFAGAFQRDIEWTVDTVLAHHAVYACVTLIASDIGKLRPKLVEMDGNGIWSETTSPAFSPVLRKPNRFQNRIQFIEWWVTSKLLRGNTYALKERDERGVVRRLYLLDPSRVMVLVAPDGSVFYRLQQDNLAGLKDEQPAVPASEIIHDRMNCVFHPLVGTSPIFAGGMAAHVGLKIQTNSAGFFANGSNPSGILSSAVTITAKKSEELSELWNSQFAGGNAGRVAVLGDGMKFEPMRMTAVDSQMLEQLKWSAEIVCSTFHVPAWKVGVGTQPAYTKPEIADQAYYSNCLQSLIEQFELCMDEGLGLGEPKDGKVYGVELDLDGLLRMDKASQVTTLKEAVGGSLLTVNDARRSMDMKPVPGGNSIWMQQQNYSLEALMERDKNDPFAKPESPDPVVPPPTAPPTQDAQKEIADLVTLVSGILPGVRDYVDTKLMVVATSTAEVSTELKAIRDEIQAKQAPSVEKDDALEKWEGWFVRDSLTLVREAKELELRVVQESIETQQRSSTLQAISELASAVLSVSEREAAVVNVAPAQVHIAPSDVHVELTMQPEAGKMVTRHSKVIRGDVGELIGVETTEVKE